MKPLTPAERRAALAYGQHGSVKAAAYALKRSPDTIDKQLRSAKAKLGVSSSVQAAIIVDRESRPAA